MESKGNNFKISLNLRTTDNNNRTNSESIWLDQAGVYPPGDVDGNRKLDLGDSIYILQTLSGIR